MPTSAEATVGPERVGPGAARPLLEPGDCLSRDEFERRYDQMPHVKKAELIEGVVYMPSPVRVKQHAVPHSQLATWLGTYAAETSVVECADNSTVRLDLDNDPQPDLVLMKPAEKGGQARISTDDYIEGAPELVVEIAGSSRAYDIHQKKDVYRRNGIREYLAWITDESLLIWWELHEGEYREIAPAPDGILKSGVYPGLWLDTAALLKGNMKEVLTTLRRGLDSAEHRAFIGG